MFHDEKFSLLDDLLILERMKDTVSPMDMTELVQVINTPKHPSYRITVERLSRNVFPRGEKKDSDPQVEPPLFKCSNASHKKDNELSGIQSSAYCKRKTHEYWHHVNQ